LTTLRQTVPISVDTKPPQLAIVVARRLVFRLSEAAVVTLIVDGKRIVKAERAGRFHVPYSRLARSVSATAVDRAGNASRPVHFP
jgi:hypothetical protein